MNELRHDILQDRTEGVIRVLKTYQIVPLYQERTISVAREDLLAVLYLLEDLQASDLFRMEL